MSATSYVSIQPYYEHAGITIYHGDCLEILPFIPKVDLVIADPPYGMAFRSNHRLNRHSTIIGDEFLNPALINAAIDWATRAAYVFCRWDNLREMPPPKSVLAWVKNNWSMGDLKHEHGRQWEAICFYPKDNHEFIKRIPDVIHEERTGNALHPTQKPSDLLCRLIGANVGAVVLDPFMGSGGTMYACRAMGRAGIGIEVDERYCEIAAKRLAQEVMDFA